jgi:hypothetical protein
MFEDDEWDLGRLALWLLVGVVGVSFFVAAALPETESTSWPAPALLDGRDRREPPPSARPGTSGWTPPSQLQREAHPKQTEGPRLPSGLFTGSRAAPDR